MTIVVIRKAAKDSHQAQTLTRKSPRPETNDAMPSPTKTRPKTWLGRRIVESLFPERPASPSKAAPRNVKRIPHAQEKRDMSLTPSGRLDESLAFSADKMSW